MCIRDSFSFVIGSEDAVNEQTLSDIKSEAERTGTFIQPLQTVSYTHLDVYKRQAEYTGDSVVSLATGEYEYTVSLPGYVSQRGTIKVADESGTPVADQIGRAHV